MLFLSFMSLITAVYFLAASVCSYRRWLVGLSCNNRRRFHIDS